VEIQESPPTGSFRPDKSSALPTSVKLVPRMYPVDAIIGRVILPKQCKTLWYP